MFFWHITHAMFCFFVDTVGCLAFESQSFSFSSPPCPVWYPGPPSFFFFLLFYFFFPDLFFPFFFLSTLSVVLFFIIFLTSSALIPFFQFYFPSSRDPVFFWFDPQRACSPKCMFYQMVFIFLFCYPYPFFFFFVALAPWPPRFALSSFPPNSCPPLALFLF